MRKFGEVYKNALKESEERQTIEILEGFKSVYESMLNKYELVSINQLDESSKISFLTELDKYWKEETGLTPLGKVFVNNRSSNLNENSTITQKSNYLKDKSYYVIKDAFNKLDIKYRIYEVLDEMFKETNSQSMNNVLKPEIITENLKDVFDKVSNEYITQIYKELKESSK